MAELFSDDYVAARARFLRAARGAGAEVTPLVHPLRAPDGGELAIDLAWLGPKDAPRILLVTSGMHGFEGPAGSAVQSVWLEAGPPALPGDCAVVFAHALNPWGFAWVSRLTENNVDLNRNFLDWTHPPPVNPFYARVRDTIRVPDMSLETLVRLGQEQARLAAELGPAAAQVAVDFGQFEDPQGITFGGSGPEFGHRALHDHLVPRLAHARQLGVIDWHTGVGAFGEIAVLPIDGDDSPVADRLVDWWGEDLVRNWRKSPLEAEIARDPRLSELPSLKTGQMNQAFGRWLPDTAVTGAVVEFGTEREGALPDLIFVVLYERWLRFVHGGDRMAPEHQPFRDTARKCFVPQDPDWRALVVREGPRLITQALAGLSVQP